MSEFAILSLASLGKIGSENNEAYAAREAIQELTSRVGHDRKKAEALLDYHVSAFKANPTREEWYKTLAMLLAVQHTDAD